MRELTKSAFTLPWALSMMGVQQIVDLVAPPAEGRLAGATAAFDAATRATEQHLDGWLDQALEIGASVQRGLAALTAVRPPTLDSSGLMSVATDRRLSSLVQATSDYGVAPAAWVDSLRLAPEDRSAALQELTNKLRVLQIVTQMHDQLDLDDADDTPLLVLVERAAALDVHQRVWAVEALGTYAGDRALEQSGGADPQDLMTDESTASLPPWSLLMLHAGVGIAFARLVLMPLEPTSSSDLVRHAIARFVALCRRSSRRGYVGASLEAFGLVARSLHLSLMPLLDREIQRVEPDLRSYFWHGAGRAMYLDPTHLWPSSNAPRSMMVSLPREAIDDIAIRNALAGIAWSTTAVNLQSPEVMELALKHHGVLAADTDAFANGIASAIVTQYDTTPDDAHIMSFMSHEPRTTGGAAAWQSLVTLPCQVAIERTYGELRQSWALGQLFHYRPGTA